MKTDLLNGSARLLGRHGETIATIRLAVGASVHGTRYGKPRREPKLPRKLKKRIWDRIAMIAYGAPLTLQMDFSPDR